MLPKEMSRELSRRRLWQPCNSAVEEHASSSVALTKLVFHVGASWKHHEIAGDLKNKQDSDECSSKLCPRKRSFKAKPSDFLVSVLRNGIRRCTVDLLRHTNGTEYLL